MQKKVKHPVLNNSSPVKNIETDVPLELLLEQDLDRKLKQIAQHKEVSVEKIILETLSKRFVKH